MKREANESSSWMFQDPQVLQSNGRSSPWSHRSPCDNNNDERFLFLSFFLSFFFFFTLLPNHVNVRRSVSTLSTTQFLIRVIVNNADTDMHIISVRPFTRRTVKSTIACVLGSKCILVHARNERSIDRSLLRSMDRGSARFDSPRVRLDRPKIVSLAGNVAEGGAFVSLSRYDSMLLLLWSLQEIFTKEVFYFLDILFLFIQSPLRFHATIFPKRIVFLDPTWTPRIRFHRPSSFCILRFDDFPVQSRVNNIHEHSREWFFYVCTRRTNLFVRIISKKAKKISIYIGIYFVKLIINTLSNSDSDN